MEMAAGLLEITDEAELDQFIGSIFNRVKQAVGQVLPPSIRQGLGGALKGLAKRYLPVAGAALGNIIAPGAGGAVGGQIASGVGRLFGLELEGLSAEDQEFEVARRYVRLAYDAAKQAAAAPPGAPPQAVVRQALASAAQKHAPGLVMGAQPYSDMTGPQGMRSQRARSGRWVRRGSDIILKGVR
jgi:hypothetical protein